MLGPLMLLAVGAVFAGWLFFSESSVANFLGHSPSVSIAYDMAHVRYDHSGGVLVDREMYGVESAGHGGEDQPIIPLPMLAGGAAAFAGLGLAYMLHLKNRAQSERIAKGLQPLTRLLEGKYWIDELYDRVVVQPLHYLGRIFFAFDKAIIDSIVWFVGMVPQVSGTALRLTVQRGYLQGYAATMLFGLLAILLICFL
jgi:NADH:ubiquinone oxidoreductase subunit 5 (subunit L)/multisubunit Na+/H+ antiporter MnhA subunit